MGHQPSFPEQANGWTAAARTQTFGRRTLFDSMNGAGELYLAYDFQRIHVHEYAGTGAARIVAEAYEMATSEDAYGVFSHDPDGEDVGIGQGNAYAAGLLRFWKGTWFFRILAERETPDARAAVLEIGRALAQPIAEGPRPSILRRLPPRDLDASSVRYFHTQVSLNLIYYLADENILDLSPRTDAAMATYRRDGEKMLLLVVRYRNSRQAEGPRVDEKTPVASLPEDVFDIETLFSFCIKGTDYEKGLFCSSHIQTIRSPDRATRIFFYEPRAH